MNTQDNASSIPYQRAQRYKLTMSRSGYIMGFLPVLAFLFQTEGFDLYHHTTSYYFDYPINRGHTLGEFIVVPRYLVLSDILRFSRMAGVPLGWVILGLCIYPAYQIGASSAFRKFKLKPSGYFLWFAVFALSLFYSGASLALLWLLAYFITRKSIFLIGLAFHPIGYLLTAAIIVLVRSIRLTAQISFFAALYFGFCYLKTLYDFPADYADTPVFLKITFQNIFTLLEFTISRKTNEIVGFVLLVTIAILASRKNRRQKFQMFPQADITLLWALIYMGSFLLFILMLTVMVIGKSSLFSYLITLQFPPPVYITWFDFGAADYSGSFEALFDMRLQ